MEFTFGTVALVLFFGSGLEPERSAAWRFSKSAPRVWLMSSPPAYSESYQTAASALLRPSSMDELTPRP